MPIVEIIYGAIIFIILYFFFKMVKINSPALKMFLFIFSYCLIISVISFFWNVSVILPDFGLNILLSELNLTNNSGNTITTIAHDKIKIPSSDKYTYSFSVYVKDAAKDIDQNNASSLRKYLFYRKDVDGANIKNIGLRLGNTSATSDFQTLYLDYTTTTNNVSLTETITSNFPIDKWTEIHISVDKTIVNIYIDGIKLTKQFNIPNLKSPSATMLIEFGNMPAYLANFSHSPTVIEPTPSFIQYIGKTDSINIG